MRPVYVAKSPKEKAMQRALIQYKNPENYELVKAALLKEGRGDLIGFSKECLIRPRQTGNPSKTAGSNRTKATKEKQNGKNKGSNKKQGLQIKNNKQNKIKGRKR